MSWYYVFHWLHCNAAESYSSADHGEIDIADTTITIIYTQMQEIAAFDITRLYCTNIETRDIFIAWRGNFIIGTVKKKYEWWQIFHSRGIKLSN